LFLSKKSREGISGLFQQYRSVPAAEPRGQRRQVLLRNRRLWLRESLKRQLKQLLL
jgi:hypothetical protein